MKERRCNKYDCNGNMRPTRNLYIPSWIEKHYKDKQTLDDFTLREYICVECGNITKWKAYPKEGDTSAACLHKFKHREGWCSISMLSDPFFCPPKPPRPQRTERPKRPVRII